MRRKRCAGCNGLRDKLRKCEHCNKLFCTVIWPGMTCGAIHRDTVKWERNRARDLATIK
jgi:hypothetical protein